MNLCYWAFMAIAFCALSCESFNAHDDNHGDGDVLAINSLRETTEGNCGDDLTWTLDKATHTLKIIGNGKMYDFESYRSIPWNESTSFIYTLVIEEGVTSIGDYSFYNLDNLTTVTIPSSVKSIGDNSFRGCDGLTSIKIPFGVERIGWHAFQSCSNLVTVELPQSLKTIGSYSFYSCAKLESIIFPYGLDSIGSYVFCYCRSLVSVFIPSTVSFIGTTPFGNCESIISIDVNESNPRFISDDGVLIDIYTKNVIDFPLARQGDYAIPGFVTTIGEGAFWSAHGLTSIIIPDNVTTIEDLAFYDCTNLTSVKIPNGVETIGDNTFGKCSNLKLVIIPASVTSVSFSAFRSCNSLTSVVYNGIINPCSSNNVFESSEALSLLCVPNNYRNDTFCGRNITCKSSSCEELQMSNNECYEVICDEDYNAKVEKRREVIAWENQTNGCVKYECGNESGLMHIGICNDDQLCTNETKCMQKETIVGYEWIVEIEISATGELNMAEIQLSLQEVSGINIDNVIIGCELNGKGEIIRIVVYVDDEESATIVLESIKGIRDDDNCEYGVLCLVQGVEMKRIDIGELSFLPLSKSSSLYPTLLLFSILLLYIS